MRGLSHSALGGDRALRLSRAFSYFENLQKDDTVLYAFRRLLLPEHDEPAD
jgi:hypothetical protein